MCLIAAEFGSDGKEYLRAKLAVFEHEVL